MAGAGAGVDFLEGAGPAAGLTDVQSMMGQSGRPSVCEREAAAASSPVWGYASGAAAVAPATAAAVATTEAARRA